MAIWILATTCTLLHLFTKAASQVDGSWGPWGAWTYSSACYAQSCGSNIPGAKSRERLCNDPPVSNGGRFCIGEDFYTETTFCPLAPCQVVDGNWGAWSSWNAYNCPNTCGVFSEVLFENRTRNCNIPVTSDGGETCPGSRIDFRPKNCTRDPCPVVVDGNWGAWSSWNVYNCPNTCGVFSEILFENRTRSCNNPVPSGGGETCPGSRTDFRLKNCTQDPCPVVVNGSWGAWSSWNLYNCPNTCGVFSEVLFENRTRSCNNPVPSGGGDTCPGSRVDFRSKNCTQDPCPVAGIWGTWGTWTVICNSSTCGENVLGVRSRSRVCNGGATCLGVGIETQSAICRCPVKGGPGMWTPWSERYCRKKCGNETAYVFRTRNCDSPQPRFGGTFCTEPLFESDFQNCDLPKCQEDLCQNAQRVDGVGYRYHLRDCDKYIQCYYNPNGNIIGVYRSCPFGLYWDQGNRKCRISSRVSCPLEKCSDTCKTNYKMDGSSRSYWLCEKGKSKGKCCPHGFSYVDGRECRQKETYSELCQNPYISRDICVKRPTWINNAAGYEMLDQQQGWTEHMCSSSTYFNIMDCGCAQQQTCSASHSLTFDSASFPSWVIVSGISVQDGIASFGVNSRISLNVAMSVSNNPVSFKIRFKTTSTVSRRQVLASSSNCNGGNSFVLSLTDDGVHFEVITRSEDVSTMALSTMGMLEDEWKTVSAMYDGHHMFGMIESSGIKYMARSYVPRSKILQCGLRIGSDGSTDSAVVFSGLIDTVSVYPCDNGMSY